MKVIQISAYPQTFSSYTHTCTSLSSIIIAGAPADYRQTTAPADRVKGAGWNLWPISQGQTGAQPLSCLLPHQPAIGDSAMYVCVRM